MISLMYHMYHIQVINPEEALILVKADSLARTEESETEKDTSQEKEG